MESLSKDDGKNNKNVKEAIGLYYQNNSFGSAPRFFEHFLAVVALL